MKIGRRQGLLESFWKTSGWRHHVDLCGGKNSHCKALGGMCTPQLPEQPGKASESQAGSAYSISILKRRSYSIPVI